VGGEFSAPQYTYLSGLNGYHQRKVDQFPVWASLAEDYLAIMASSVSSERAFSSAGLTITKRRSRLKGDIVEALQVLKCKIKGSAIMRSAAEPSLAREEDLESKEAEEDNAMTEVERVVAEGDSDDEDFLLSDDECYE
jgi:hypothetical protein